MGRPKGSTNIDPLSAGRKTNLWFLEGRFPEVVEILEKCAKEMEDVFHVKHGCEICPVKDECRDVCDRKNADGILKELEHLREKRDALLKGETYIDLTYRHRQYNKRGYEKRRQKGEPSINGLHSTEG